MDVDVDDRAYLEEGFDPLKLKVADLKRVLIKHHVDFSASAKKAELVDLFNANVAPRAAELIQKAKSVKPDYGARTQSTPGRATPKRASKANVPRRSKSQPAVVDRANGSETESDADLKDRPLRTPKVKDTPFSDENPFQSASDATPAPKRVRSLRKKKTSSVTIVDPAAEKAEQTTKTPKPAPAAKPSSLPYRGGYLSMMNTPPLSVKQPLTVELGATTAATPTRPTSTTPFKKFMTPIIPLYSKAPPKGATTTTSIDDAESPVSAPGASPVSSVGTPTQKPRKPRVSTPYPSKGVLSLSRRRVTPSSHAGEESDELDVDDDNVGSTEDEAETNETDEEYNKLLEQRRRRRMLRTRRSASLGFSKLLGILLAGYLVWYRFRLKQEGYCDSDLTMTVGEGVTPEANPLSFLQPTCHPCPAHGHCQNQRLISCDHEFVLRPRYQKPFDILSTNPVTSPFFPMRCKPDTETKRKAAVLRDAVADVLNERAGEVECREKAAKSGKVWPEGDKVVVMKDRGHSVAELHEKFYRMKDPSLSDARFEELWKLAVRDLKSTKDEIDYIPPDSQEQEEYLVSRYPKYPFVCFVRLQAVKAVVKHRIALGVSLFASVLLFTIKRLWKRYSREVSEANDLVELVFEKLQDQEHNHYVDPVLSPTPTLSVTQLKDFLMTGDNWSDAKRRERVWQRAYAKIDNNSNVRSRVTEIKGEPHHVWEWIGGYGLTAERPPRVDKLYPTA